MEPNKELDEARGKRSLLLSRSDNGAQIVQKIQKVVLVENVFAQHRISIAEVNGYIALFTLSSWW